MDSTAIYTDSLIKQALTLPDLLRPLLIDESARGASSKLGELASEMKSIANVSSRLVTRCRSMTHISISAENQVELEDAITDAKDISRRIEERSKALRGMKFSITWKINKLVKFAKKTYSNVEKIEQILSPHFTADAYLVSLIRSDTKIPDSDTGLVLTDLDIKNLKDPSVEQKSHQGLKKLFSDSAIAP